MGYGSLLAELILTSLLKTIQKIENFEFPALNNFLAKYKDYSEQLNLIIKIVLSEEMAVDGGRIILEGLDSLKEETNFVYEELINISAIARDENLVQVSHQPLRPGMVCNSILSGNVQVEEISRRRGAAGGGEDEAPGPGQRGEEQVRPVRPEEGESQAGGSRAGQSQKGEG